MNLRLAIWAFGFGMALFLLCFLLWPGVSGPFVFDDMININRLGQGAGGCIASKFDFLWYTFGGPSPGGRPLSFLSFLLHDFCWPTDPRPFKIFNVLWHCLNFCLVILLLRGLMGRPASKATIYLPLLLAFAWAVHPIHVSALFLTVQRMTLLMSTFLLIGFIMYIRGRHLLVVNPLKGHAFMWGGLAVGGILGSLSKETAIFMPIYVLALEFTWLASTPRGPRRLWLAFSIVCLALPLLMVFLFIFVDAGQVISQSWIRREFTPLEKLLTETRVLLTYLQQLVLPDLKGFGIYQDDFQLSKSLFEPQSTIFACLFWIAALFFAVAFRRRAPWLSLGVLWFFGGHFFEAFVAPVEVYFEHRNYLPSLGVIFFVTGLLQLASPRLRRVLPVIAVIMISLLGFMTWSNAKVWSSEASIFSTLYRENPDSVRSLQAYLKWGYDNRNWEVYKEALEKLQEASKKDLTLRMTDIMLDCGADFDARWKRLVHDAYHAEHSTGVLNYMNKLVIKTPLCRKITNEQARSLLKALLSNPKYVSGPTYKQRLLRFYAQTYRQDGQLYLAMYFSDWAYEVKVDPSIPAEQSIWLASAGLFDEALRYVDKALNTEEDIPYFSLKGRPAYERLKQGIERQAEKSRSKDEDIGSNSGKE